MISPMERSAAESARRLAETLVEQQTSLDSDDLTTVSIAMTAVRAAARELESALMDRGWGGGVLYGFGDADDDLEDDDDDDDDDADEEEEDEQPQPLGVRMTYQARHDFVVTDGDALAAYIAGRLSAEQSAWTADEVEDHGLLMMLAQLDGMGSRDYSAFGLVYAGGQDASHEIPQTLWEMEPDEGDDQFPTAG